MAARLALRAGVLLAGAALACAAPAAAQGSGDGFLFREPRGAFQVRGGFDQAFAGGDLFSFVTSELTLRRGDFGAASLAADLSARLGPRLDVVFSAAVAATSTRSEYRDWVDQDDQPIEQTTTLRRVPLSVSLKWFLRPRGRAIGSFAWVPARTVPYVGAGAGAMYYRFRQRGDFVDFTHGNSVFPDDYTSADFVFAAHAFAGLDVSLGPHFFLTGETRYTWARASLGSDFSGYGRIDLSGLSATAGVGFRM